MTGSRGIDAVYNSQLKDEGQRCPKNATQPHTRQHPTTEIYSVQNLSDTETLSLGGLGSEEDCVAFQGRKTPTKRRNRKSIGRTVLEENSLKKQVERI